jgi:hypothetical protein
VGAQSEVWQSRRFVALVPQKSLREAKSRVSFRSNRPEKRGFIIYFRGKLALAGLEKTQAIAGQVGEESIPAVAGDFGFGQNNSATNLINLTNCSKHVLTGLGIFAKILPIVQIFGVIQLERAL